MTIENTYTKIREKPVREKMPSERQSLTHKFAVNGQKGYLTLGFYEDGALGEIFLRMAKEGSTIGGLVGGWAAAVSVSLQYGVEPEAVFRRYVGERFEPMGATSRGYASSIYDYVAKYVLDATSPGWRERLGMGAPEVPQSESKEPEGGTLAGPDVPPPAPVGRAPATFEEILMRPASQDGE